MFLFPFSFIVELFSGILPFNLFTYPHIINQFYFGKGVVIYYSSDRYVTLESVLIYKKLVIIGQEERIYNIYILHANNSILMA